ncbi:MAG TPA: nuclear transport factor 2 family protein [Terriglobales bacterium]|nr:nuclear transport factor 2 family protein [Terriglobales bacterium]
METAVVSDPITGEEDLGNLHQPEQALAQFYRALNRRNIDLMAQNWDSSSQAAMDNPLGGIKRGWREIRPVYERIFNGGSSYHFEFYDYTLHLAENIFYAVGRERGYYEKKGTRLEMKIRTTRVFRRIDGRWRQVHHHGSIEDPQLLAAYQRAVSS